jgi:hypothetical protein
MEMAWDMTIDPCQRSLGGYLTNFISHCTIFFILRIGLAGARLQSKGRKETATKLHLELERNIFGADAKTYLGTYHVIKEP